MGNQAIRLWDYAWRASVPRDFIVQFKVFDVGATACYTEKIRYLLGLELDKDGEQSVDPNHPSRTYYINKIRELLL
ncbi:MAG: hypothetical protein U9Q15_00100 [Patescibacteria group bacterium]|nr:hypothetical protein [Patescibacteria group bacterium]